MNDKGSIHAGHRERMLLKFKTNPDAMLEHELLEVMLYPVLPRIDTNPLAHRLINTFGSFSAVFSATYSQLVAVSGVGDKTANYILLIGKGIQTVINQQRNAVVLNGFEALKKVVLNLFDGVFEEKIILFMLDRNYKKVAEIDFSNKDLKTVSLEVPEVANAFALYKPNHVILAHNHPSGKAEPSNADDISTKKIKLLCDSFGVDFTDHVIVGKGEVFSYVRSGIMDDIKKKADLKKLLEEME